MEAKKLLLVIALTIPCSSFVTGGPISAVIDVAGFAFDVLKFGRNLMSLMDNSGEAEENSDEIIATLNSRIDASTTTIITNVVLQSKLDRVDDAVINVYSSLIDIRNVIRASDQNEKDEQIKLFVSRFEENGLITHIRFLPELLEYTIPGTTGKLVDLFADNTRCNMTAIYEFTQFYCQLLSDGIALNLLYLRLTSMPISNTLEHWHDQASNLKRIFDKQEQSCVQKFAEYAKRDVEAASDALSLWTNSNDRYPWKTNDVIFLKKYGTFQLLYFQYGKSSDHMFVHKSDKKTKIAIFTDRNEPKQTLSISTDAKETFQSAIQGKDDKDAAKHVGLAVRDYLKRIGHYLKALVVFFDNGEELSPLKVKIDENSTVLRLTLEDVELRFCYKIGIQCAVDVANVFGSTKTVVGKMKVFAYVGSDEQDLNETGSGTKTAPFTICVNLLIPLGLVLLHIMFD